MNESSVIDPLIRSSEKLGALTPAAIFAFMWLWQSWKEFRRESNDKDAKKKENERREQSIISEERQTEAMKAIAQNVVMLRDAQNSSSLQLSKLTTIIEERVPHHVFTQLVQKKD